MLTESMQDNKHPDRVAAFTFLHSRFRVANEALLSERGNPPREAE